MKRTILIFTILICPLFIFANLVKDTAFTQLQPDGTKLTLYVSGDEYYRQVHDGQGYTVLKQSQTGYAVYAIPDGKGIKTSEYIVGKVNPASLGISPNLTEEQNVVDAGIRAAREHNNPLDTRNNTTGQFNNLVVFIRFYDQQEFPTSHNRVYYNTFFNGTGSTDVSMKKFFLEESNNQFTTTSYMYPNSSNNNVVAYVDTHPRGYYMWNDYYNPDGYTSQTQGYERLATLLNNVMSYLENSNQILSSLDVDANNDGKVDNVSFVIRGEKDYWSSPLWPHHWNFDELGTPITYLNGKQVWDYTINFETNGTLGTQCHEFSHSLGFPDLYHYHWYTSVLPADRWDLMCLDNDIPQHHLVYMKYKYGHWVSIPPTITTDGLYSLPSVATNPFSAFKIESTFSNQYYMVEYRKQEGLFESDSYGSGLIIYRINTSVTGGNVEGPSDEVYVYRPNGSNTNQGFPENSFYSAESGRTAMHTYSDPPPRLSDWSYDGGLIITEVGSAGQTITFRKRSTMPKVWEGLVDNDWTNPLNWVNGVPTQNDDVEITERMFWHSNDPQITSTVNCKNLHIDVGSSVNLTAGILIIHENLVSNGALVMNGISGVNVYGSTTWDYGSTVGIADASSFLSVRGDMNFQPGSNINMTIGRIEFSDPGISVMRVNEVATISNLISYKTSPNYLSVSSISDHNLFIYGGLFVGNGKVFKNYHPGNIYMRGDLTVSNGGFFNCYDGTMYFASNATHSITNNSADGNDFYHLKVEMNNATLSLNSAIMVKKNLIIQFGVLQPNNYTIESQGDWYNAVGENGFVEGTGQVIFSGSADQTCSGEHFATLVLNKSGGELITVSTVRCQSYDWTAGAIKVNSGNFMADDLADNGIYGTFTLGSGQIDLFQDASSLIDINGFLIVHGGSFNIHGGSAVSRWANLANAGITMDGGILDFMDFGILNRYTTYAMTLNLTGGRIRTSSSLTISRSNTVMNSGTFELYGPTDAIVSFGAGTGSKLPNLIIDKLERELKSDEKTIVRSSSKTSTSENLRANKVTVGSNLILTGTLTVQNGTLDVAAKTVEVTGGVVISGTLLMAASGAIVCAGDFIWGSNSIGTITGGSISYRGNWKFYRGCNVNLSSCPVTFLGNFASSITSCSNTANFGNLTLTGTPVGEPNVQIVISSDSTVPLVVTGLLALSNTNYFYLGGKTLRIDDHVSITTNSLLYVDADAILKLANTKALTVYTSGALVVIGSLGHPATITHQTGNYLLNINTGGMIRAKYAVFEYMSTAGVNVKTGATVDTTAAFHYCTFQNGTASGTLLTIDNAQTFSIYGAVFPTNTWSGSYNVTKTAAQGNVTFINASGGFSGAGHENDALSRISWTTSTAELSITSYNADHGTLYVCDPNTYRVTISNNSTSNIIIPIRVDVYYDRISQPAASEEGDQIGYINSLNASSSITYTFPVTSSTTSGSWHTWFRVDTLNEIAEANESNNGGGSLTTTWSPLPVVAPLTISYNESTNNVELT